MNRSNTLNTIYLADIDTNEYKWLQNISQTFLYKLGRLMIPFSLLGIMVSWILAFSEEEFVPLAHPINIISILIFVFFAFGPFTQSPFLWFGPFYYGPLQLEQKSIGSCAVSLFVLLFILLFTSPIAAGISFEAEISYDFKNVLFSSLLLVVPFMFFLSISSQHYLKLNRMNNIKNVEEKIIKKNQSNKEEDIVTKKKNEKSFWNVLASTQL